MTALRRGTGGQPISTGGKVAAVAFTLSTIVIVIVAACAAFFFTCLATYAITPEGHGEGGFVFPLLLGLALGGVAAVAAGILVARLFSRALRRRRGC